MYEFIKIRHDIRIECQDLYGDKKIKHMLEIEILRNSSQKDLGVLRGVFKGLCVQKDTLLAKTMSHSDTY